MVKRIVDGEWRNIQWIKRFVNPMQQYITCTCGGLHIAEPGLMVDSPADKICLKF